MRKSQHPQKKLKMLLESIIGVNIDYADKNDQLIKNLVNRPIVNKAAADTLLDKQISDIKSQLLNAIERKIDSNNPELMSLFDKCKQRYGKALDDKDLSVRLIRAYALYLLVRLLYRIEMPVEKIIHHFEGQVD